MEKERRRFKRFDAFLGIKYSGQTPHEARGICLTRDLSREGMLMTVNEKLDKGQVFDLEIDIPDDPRPAHATAEIVWSCESKNSRSNYEVGVRFLVMDPVDKFRVLDYAYNHWLETKVNDYYDPEKIAEMA